MPNYLCLQNDSQSPFCESDFNFLCEKMGKHIHKSLQECLSKIKNSNKQIKFQLRSLKQLRTPQLGVSGGSKEKEDDAATLSDIDNFLFENFRSLFLEEYEEEISKRKGSRTTAFLFDSPRFLDLPLPENLSRSDRFFVSTGSTSSRIVDEARSSSSTAPVELPEATAANDSTAPEDFIALLTYSPSPYEDFRRSMQEMVDARAEHNGIVDWQFLEELLFCYLDLNNKKSYRFILRAFVDLIVVLRENYSRGMAGVDPPRRR